MTPISHTARVTLNAPIEEIDLEGWLFGLSDADYQATDLACTVEVHLRPVLGVLARLSLLGRFLRSHVDEEAQGFAADVTRKRRRMREPAEAQST